ncbi:branched-chain amino acid transport system ATP-binding protein [Pseudomonas sp. JUb42]|jgi:branched-chain amino acid transport system ATP-binding protein|uniref:ABC transporter ATP-binding protein n=1 Tax=Pseudomonas sp. JUb42 TaxID=2940611 RepID=UPI002167867D|nr:ABC transporter ATP-binding protein [Pseudomonas sp. JUb42]MCS3472350.1 branched-chain amino acid transport system ATP-binding protein [Pseudomonas sp. JUb42]
MMLLEFNNLVRRFGGLSAIDNVSGHVAKGELVGLIGPNGAGKTTLFNLITGFVPLSSGSVHLNGRDITGRAPHVIARQGLSRTFQNLRIFPNMTVFDNTSVAATGVIGQGLFETLLGRRSRAKRISERTWQALEQVGLQHLADDLAANLSYGQRKYLEIARALAMAPELLILDEPAAGLNDTETAELAACIRRLHGEGLSIMLVEHDMNLVMSICERIIVLASGKKIADASPLQVRGNAAVLESYLGTDEP